MRLSVLSCIALAASPLAASAQSPLGTPPQPAVVASARGETRIPPDRATVHFTVETRAATAAQASAQNATRQRAVLDALRKAGLGDDQLSTTGYSLMPDVQWDQEGRRSRVVGYVARNTVRADVRQLSELGKLIDTAIGAGSNGVGALDFTSSKEADARQEALRVAMRRACQDAAVLASATGGTVGPLLEAQTTTEMPPRPYAEMMVAGRAQADTSTPITPGELTIEATVTTRWAYLAPGAEGTPTTCR